MKFYSDSSQFRSSVCFPLISQLNVLWVLILNYPYAYLQYRWLSSELNPLINPTIKIFRYLKNFLDFLIILD